MIVSCGYATITEIDQNWTYTDLLKCFLYIDIEAVRAWKASTEEQDKTQEWIKF